MACNLSPLVTALLATSIVTFEGGRKTRAVHWDSPNGNSVPYRRRAYLLADEAIASRLQDLLGDRFHLIVCLGTHEEYEEVLIVTHVGD